MNKYLQFGVSEDFEGYKNQAIATSNLIFIFQFIMGTVAVVLSRQYMPDLSFLAYIFLSGITLCLILNYFGLPDVGRFLFILVNALVISLLNAVPLSPGEPVFIHLYLAQLSIAVLPWIIIDLREGGFVYLGTAVALAFFIFQPFIIESFTMEINREFLESDIMYYFIYTFSLVNIIITIYVLSYRNALNESNGKKMLDDINEKSMKMEEQQNEIQSKINDLNTTHKAEENRSWVGKNLTQINDIIRNSKNENIFPELAEEMVKCLNADQVAIYLLNEEENNPFLEMKGCYAIDRRKFSEIKLSVDEGVVGQSFKDKEFIYITNLPKNHLRFVSGLGDEPPQNLAMVPLLENENITGIMEVVSHHPFEEKEILFFSQVSETIASFVLSNVVNIKIKYLIEQNQVQAEEMKAQEEEMLQNMEELQATQEEMSRKEKEYLVQIEKLESELASKNL